ncbi:DNA polymerase I [Candidatus Parcubacteria bacterium]|nr:DNA polymerase I [Candidatus Parcubacteria bacterium]
MVSRAHKKKTVVLIDGHALIHRAYHALPPLTAAGGEVVNAVYGFVSLLLKMYEDLQPDYVLAAFDLPGPTFRHEAFEEYKAQRAETPSDLDSQFPKVKEVLGAFNVPVLEAEGFEADDVIGTLVEKLEEHDDVRLVILTGDLDTLQLVSGKTSVYTLKRGMSDTVEYTPKGVRERYEGIKPSQVADLKGLKGDPSDNIPGVPGVGEKTAIQLLQEFGTIERLYALVEKPRLNQKSNIKMQKTGLSPKLIEKLLANKDQAFFSKELATIRRDAPIQFRLEDAAVKDIDRAKVQALFKRFGFYTLLNRLPSRFQPSAPAKTTHPAKTAAFSAQATSIALALTEDGQLDLASGAEAAMTVNSADIPQDVKSLLVSPRVTKIFHDQKAVLRKIHLAGAECAGETFDTLIAAYLLAPGSRDYSLERIAFREFRRTPGALAHPAALAYELVPALRAKLEGAGAWRLFSELEMPLVSVLARMEEAGIAVDAAALRELSKTLERELAKRAAKIYQLAGEEFNINSTQALRKILFEKLQLSVKGLKKTPTGELSTAAGGLEKLREAHPIVALILEYREIFKVKSTYADALPELINSKTDRVHTTFNQTVTATGRLSSSDPNLQNIPTFGEYGKAIRNAFVAAKGYTLLSCDYSQLQLRIAASLAKDEKMLAAFRAGRDIHALTAAEIFAVPIEKVTPEQRREAKALNFGVLYGMGATGFAESAGIDRGRAKEFIERYKEEFSGISVYMEAVKMQARNLGYVETLLGRRRYLPEILSPNHMLQAAAERMAINHPIQGLEADIVKLAMIEIDKLLRGRAEDCRMLLQVHDELVFEIRPEVVEELALKIIHAMESVFKLAAPLVAEAKAGERWGNMMEYQISNIKK